MSNPTIVRSFSSGFVVLLVAGCIFFLSSSDATVLGKDKEGGRAGRAAMTGENAGNPARGQRQGKQRGDGQQRQRPDGQRGGGMILRALDSDGDGVISSAELGNALAALRALDRNGDGQLTKDEIRPQGQREGKGGASGNEKKPRPEMGERRQRDGAGKEQRKGAGKQRPDNQ